MRSLCLPAEYKMKRARLCFTTSAKQKVLLLFLKFSMFWHTTVREKLYAQPAIYLSLQINKKEWLLCSFSGFLTDKMLDILERMKKVFVGLSCFVFYWLLMTFFSRYSVEWKNRLKLKEQIPTPTLIIFISCLQKLISSTCVSLHPFSILLSNEDKKVKLSLSEEEWRRQAWSEGSQLGIVIMAALTHVSNENQNEDRVSKNKRGSRFEKQPLSRRSKLCDKKSRQQVWGKMLRFLRKTCGFELPGSLQVVIDV